MRTHRRPARQAQSVATRLAPRGDPASRWTKRQIPTRDPASRWTKRQIPTGDPASRTARRWIPCCVTASQAHRGQVAGAWPADWSFSSLPRAGRVGILLPCALFFSLGSACSLWCSRVPRRRATTPHPTPARPATRTPAPKTLRMRRTARPRAAPSSVPRAATCWTRAVWWCRADRARQGRLAAHRLPTSAGGARAFPRPARSSARRAGG